MSFPPKSMGQNFAVLSLGQLASRFLTFLASVHLAKALGTDGMGQLLIFTSVLAYAASFADFGIQKIGPVKIGRADEPLDELVSNVVILRSLIAVPVMLILLVLTAVWPLSVTQKMVALMYVLSITTNIFDLGWVFIGTRWVMPSVICNIASQSFYAAGVFLFIKSSQQIGVVPVAFLASNLVLVVGQLLFFATKYKFRFKFPNLCHVKELSIAALPLMASSVVGLILVNFEILITGACLNASASGLFGVASKLTAMLILLVSSYFAVLAPLMASAYRAGTGPLEELLKVSLKLSTSLSVGVVAGGLILSDSIVLMLYGPAFHEATVAFQILLFSFGLIAISRNYRTCLLATGHQAVDIKVVSISAIVTVITCPLMVTTYGIAGAAWVAVLAEVTMLAGFVAAVRRLNLSLPFLPYVGKPLICAAIMSLCLLALPNLPTVVRIAEGAAIYIVAMLVLKVTSLSEVREFLSGSMPAETFERKSQSSSSHSIEPVASMAP
jgi:polysaccharide transporter, PST family